MVIKLQIPQYRFHYYVQNDKTKDQKPSEGRDNNGEKVQSVYSVADSNEEVKIVNYRVDKSSGLQADVNIQDSALPFKMSLNNPEYSGPQIDVSENSTVSRVSPIVVEPMNMQEQKSSKSIEVDSRNEYHLTGSTDKAIQLTQQVNTNQTEDRKDDVKEEQVTDQVLVQDEGITNKQIEFTIPFKKSNPVNTDDFKYNDDEAIKKNIVKVIQNIKENHEQSDQQLTFKNVYSDKPVKIVGSDSTEMEQQESYQSSNGHSNFKSQQLSNKPLRLFGYNPSIIGSLYDMQVDYKRPSQIQQPPNPLNQGYFTGLGTHGDIRPHTYDNSGMYLLPQPIPITQTVGYKGNQKYNAPTQPLYYYDPNSMAMLPIYTNMIQNTYPIAENKPQTFQQQLPQPQPLQPQPPQQQQNQPQSGFNLMHILSGGSFYKSSEQAEGSQQTTVKDSIVKQESNKLEKLKPSETHDKSKQLPPTVMFYLNPSETPVDLKSLTSSSMQLSDQQAQADCNGKKSSKSPSVKPDKPLQPIPLCSDCVPALGLMGLTSTKSNTIQQKKSIISPQVMPIWNGHNVSKLNYLILPNPITK